VIDPADFESDSEMESDPEEIVNDENMDPEANSGYDEHAYEDGGDDATTEMLDLDG